MPTFEIGGKFYEGAVAACRAERPQDYREDLKREWNAAIASGLPVPPSYPDSVYEECLDCGITVQVGPRLQAKREELVAQGVQMHVMCILCSAHMVARDMASDDPKIDPEPYNLGNPYQDPTERRI